MTSPHRAAPITADLSIEVNGIPYSARVTLTPGKLPERSPGLSLVRVSEEKVERANCAVCAYYTPATFSGIDALCMTAQNLGAAINTGRCEFFNPSLLTRLLRAFRLGRPPVYLANPTALESAPEHADEDRGEFIPRLGYAGKGKRWE